MTETEIRTDERKKTLQEIAALCKHWLDTDLPRHGYRDESVQFKQFVSAQKSGILAMYGELCLRIKG